jgi:hypothetical protein
LSFIKDIIVESFRNRIVNIKLSRSDYYKLLMICEAINEKVDVEYEVTPDMIATRVLEKFIEQSFEDSTNKLVNQIIPDVRRLPRG